jgi:hypothetical protein
MLQARISQFIIGTTRLVIWCLYQLCCTPDRILILLSAAWLLTLWLNPDLHDNQTAYYCSVGILSVNALFSLWTMTAKRKVLVTLNLTQIVLFAFLNYQLYSAFSKEHFQCEREPRLYDWAEYTVAHCCRAADVLDALDEYEINLQHVKHNSIYAGTLLVLMHLSVDCFLIGLLVRWVSRFWQRQDEREVVIMRKGCAWSLVTAAIFVGLALGQGWSRADWYLWPLDNALRLVDVGDAFQIFGWRLHGVEMGFWTRTYALVFRFAVGFWLARLLLSIRLSAFRGWGLSIDELIQQLSMGDEADRRGAAVALARMGPDAEEAVPALVRALAHGSLGVRCRAAHALGRIGPTAYPAVPVLAEVLWKQNVPPTLLVEVVKALGNVGPVAAGVVPDLCFLLKVSDKRMEPVVIQALEKIAAVSKASCPDRETAQRDKAAPPRRLQRGEAASLLLALRDNGFFAKERTIGEIQAELAATDHYVSSAKLSSPLAALARQGQLSRRKNEKLVWLYVSCIGSA